MTLPSEEVHAIQRTGVLLADLVNRRYRPGWKELRRRASALLKHYPYYEKVEEVYLKAGQDPWSPPGTVLEYGPQRPYRLEKRPTGMEVRYGPPLPMSRWERAKAAWYRFRKWLKEPAQWES